MRAARLLQILLLLQNRGRMTSAQLAAEVEVTPRTILRDVDAMTEAGLPIIVFQGNQGGIELGFDYRTRLTGLDEAEAQALGVALGAQVGPLAQMGLARAFETARRKLIESFPDRVRAVVQRAALAYPVKPTAPPPDPRVGPLTQAVWTRQRVRINATGAARLIHPVGVGLTVEGWTVTDALTGEVIPLADCGDINISALTF